MTDDPSDRPRAIVLVVEDEPVQRMNMVDLVEENGFEVAQAWNAASALKVLEQRTDIRLVLSDVDMPNGMNGVELAALVRGRWPPIEMLLVSAGPLPSTPELRERAVFMEKPLDYELLATVLARMAARAASSRGEAA